MAVFFLHFIPIQNKCC